MTVLDLITAAMQHLVVLGQGQTASPEDATYGFGRLNNMVDSWNSDDLMLYTRPQVNSTLTNGVGGPYLFGPAQTPGPRPTLIQAANIVPYGTTLSLPLDLIDVGQWSEIEDKAAIGARPQRLYCDYAFPNANVYVHPCPLGAATLQTWPILQLAQFATLQDVLTFPAGYLEALEFDLAVTLSGGFGKQVPQTVMLKAEAAKTRVRQLNQRYRQQIEDAIAAGMIPRGAQAQLPAGGPPAQ